MLRFLFLLLAPSVTFAQSSSSQEIGNTTWFLFDGVSGSRQSIGNTDVYHFSHGSSTTRNRIGNTEVYTGSNPSLSG